MFIIVTLFSITSFFKPDPILYGITSAVFETTSYVTHMCGRITQNKECFLLSTICDHMAQKTWRAILKKRHNPYHSWNLNKKELKCIPSPLASDKKLLSFLQQRYLYKFAGFDSWLVHYAYPCFGINMQIHPETSNSYERDPSEGLSKKYVRIASSLSKLPLILTRPYDLTSYFPSYIEVKDLQASIALLAAKMQKELLPIIVDFTSLNDIEIKEFYDLCKEASLDIDDMIGIQWHKKDELGALTLIENEKEKYRFLLNLISRSGLTANGVDLDRFPKESYKSSRNTLKIKVQTPDDFLLFLQQIKPCNHEQKNLMLQATLSILNCLVTRISDKKWEEIYNTTPYYVALHSFEKIEEHLSLLSEEKSFFEYAGKLEEIHAEMGSLIEIFGPFKADDFSYIYQSLLTQIPDSIKPLTSSILHSSAMTSFAAIVKCIEKTKGSLPLVLYGSNTYYECINFSDYFANGSCLDHATVTELEECDIILTQFHPVLNLEKKADYKIENVSQIIHKVLLHCKRPLTIALDCTFDQIDSSNVGDLLQEFQNEIIEGKLNVCCFRSGVKFDMLGMDNYWGAPFFMIHNQDRKWEAFDDLIKSPLLMTDNLSLNWFCLAYKNSGLLLEKYRKHIFDNTRLLLDNTPLLDPMDIQLDPAFVSMKVHGPMHRFKAKLIVSYLCISCMESGHPLFFRPSIGFYHANCAIFSDDDYSTIRLTLGLDPKQVEVLSSSLLKFKINE